MTQCHAAQLFFGHENNAENQLDEQCASSPADWQFECFMA
jgi:hypothetical protein